ncbi:glycosyl hydrolase [Streptomyces solincola]|uniref:Glycosyl hydrolase n=1 Tax=Streptomyces solincola TaxID=2100817 RepID=A0A2S9PZ37_9ACTN|nr:glycoside hydrolase family 3 C-terminal domain-containing protein [Streptomyces solincola]PRH79690.1 glycosyl hydrolase [Streptomyces solincola]
MGEDEISTLLGKLDLPRKVRLLTGASTWRTHAEPAVGLAALTLSDGPAGVRGPAWDERSPSVLLPCASALAAAWDEPLVERLGALLAAEARRKGVHVVLAPTLNLHRSPLGGRHFECFAEDPELAGRTGAALIRGLQENGVAAAAKHYTANDAETDRLTVDVRVGERALREVYLAPFEAAVEAGVRLVMAGYNAVDGVTMTQSPLLAQPLKGAWGFDGVVVSDWGAARSVTAAAAAATDLVMPGPEGPWGEALVAAVRSGAVPESAVDDKVRRLLRLAGRVGALDPVAERPQSAPAPGAGQSGAALLRTAVAAGTVLLENRGVLPLDPAALRSLAVIGAHAAAPRAQGGGSAGVFPYPSDSPLDAVRLALPATVDVLHAAGPAVHPPAPVGLDGIEALDCRDPRTGRPGVRLRVLDGDGAELHTEYRLSGRLLEPPLPPGAHTLEVTALVRPTVAGEWTWGVGGFGRLELTVGDATLVDGEFPAATDDPALLHVSPPCRYGRIRLPAGRPVRVAARRRLDPGAGRAVLLTAAPPAPDPAAAIAEAVRAARAADAAVVCVGTTEESECEGRDRTGLVLPGPQDALVEAVAAANPRTAVVVTAGGPVELPWRTRAGAVLLGWFPGQEGGAGLADVLLGRAEPGGRLPTTWPARLADAPVTATAPRAGRLSYDEGLHIGHRAWLRRQGPPPAYWFGHGLGYTAWAYEESAVQGPAGAGGPHRATAFTVRVRLRNTGARAGREVVQVYLARPGSAVERPVRWFAGYAAVRAAAGAAVTAEVPVPWRALRHWSPQEGRWRWEPGRYEVLIGPSAGRIALSDAVRLRCPS